VCGMLLQDYFGNTIYTFEKGKSNALKDVLEKVLLSLTELY